MWIARTPAPIDEDQISAKAQPERSQHVVTAAITNGLLVEQQLLPGNIAPARAYGAHPGTGREHRVGELRKVHGRTSACGRKLSVELRLFLTAVYLPDPEGNETTAPNQRKKN